MLRRGLALLVLCAHVSAVGHLLLAQHTLDESGAVVDAAQPCDLSGHGAAGIAHGHAVEQLESDCEVATVLRSLGQAAPERDVSLAAIPPGWPASIAAAEQVRALEVLSVAPKASPPSV